MGRELRRKQAKKEGKSLHPEIKEETNQLKKLLIITAVLIFIICIIYILSALFVTKELDWLDKKDENITETLIENTILAAETFTVRKISSGVGVERTFPVNSPNIASIEVVKKGKVRRAKLYFLRTRESQYKIKERR